MIQRRWSLLCNYTSEALTCPSLTCDTVQYEQDRKDQPSLCQFELHCRFDVFVYQGNSCNTIFEGVLAEELKQLVQFFSRISGLGMCRLTLLKIQSESSRSFSLKELPSFVVLHRPIQHLSRPTSVLHLGA